MPDPSASRLGYCKLCELEDFRDPDLRELIRDMSGVGPERPGYPDGEEHRKPWEIAMTARALRDFGALREDAEILGVGAGTEATIFWLTRHVKRVFATDLYLTEDSWSELDSGAGMLHAPEQETTLDWNPRRLVVQHMDALDLAYEDDSFDGIFSSGSIEHFGGLDNIRKSVEEMYRVVRPGGVVALATEFRLGGPSPGIPGTWLFDESELRQVALDDMGWKLASPVDLSISDATMEAPVDFDALFVMDAAKPSVWAKVQDALGRKPPPPAVRHLPTPYPHIVLWKGEHMWTSVHLTLIKPERG
ncbi:MAG TPA: class I SAM-dependent methyltransferase [Solirubrobacterales bacterium]|nr:class I SAM-dependent methyltransferase [Solirubrobacterales bacterium]